MDPGTATLITGLASSATAAANGIASGKMNKRAQKYNEETRDLQHQWQVESATTAYERQRQLLHEQQNYDSPQAQMQRLRQAGLNPNLAYGTIGGSTSVPNVPQADATMGPQQNPNQQVTGWSGLAQSLNEFLPALQQLMMTDKTLENTSADTENKKADTDKKVSETQGQNITNSKLEESIDADIQLKNKQSELAEQEANKLKKYIRDIMPEEQRKLQHEINKLTEEISQIQQLTPQMVKEYQAKIMDLVASAKLKTSQRHQVNQEVRNFIEFRRNQNNLMRAQQHQAESAAQMQDLKNKTYKDLLFQAYAPFGTHGQTHHGGRMQGFEIPDMEYFMSLGIMENLMNMLFRP